MKIQQVFHVFLDTEFFITNNFQFKFEKFKNLIELVQTEKILLYSTKITCLEVKRNIEKEVENTLKFFKFHKNETANYKILRNFERCSGLFEKFDVGCLVQDLVNEYRKFFQESKTILIDMNNVSIDTVFSKYFEIKPPFSQHKKDEFQMLLF